MRTDITPIRNDADHEVAILEIEKLWGAPVGSPEGDRLEVLATLVDVYERERFTFDQPDPIDVITSRIHDLGMTRADLVPILGGRNRVSEVLNKQRSLSLKMIRQLHESLDIPLELLIQPTLTNRKRT